MGSLINSTQKNYLQSVFEYVHDTFSRPIYYYKEAKTLVLNTNPDFNPIYQQNGAPSSTTIKKVVQSGSFNARIQYDTDKSESYVSSHEIDSQLKLRLPDGYVRLKVDKNGLTQLRKTKRLEFDGRRFSVESDVRPHGLFEPSYYTFFLLPVDSTSLAETKTESAPADDYKKLSDGDFISAIDLWHVDPISATATYGPIGSWDVSAVTTMTQAFKNRTSFNEDISAWNVSNVTNMDEMFYNAESFNQNLTSWDVTSVSSYTDFDGGSTLGSWTQKPSFV